tara:strand:- start:1 stop:366 length:366 start_codon:yes stop_codon:yes gene_type:complete
VIDLATNHKGKTKMKQIKIAGLNLRISASDERGLRILQAQNYIAASSDFTEGRGRHMTTCLPMSQGRPRKDLGLGTEWKKQMYGQTPRAIAFFKKRPRCRSAVIANPRRLNLIIKKLEACA